MTHRLYRFRGCELHAATRELRRDGAVVVLPTSAFDCLLYLVEHRDRAIGRDELISAVWARADVTDTLLGQTILRVRRAIGDSGGEDGAVRTLPRFGYRFVADVDVVEIAAAPEPVVEMAVPAPLAAPAAPAMVPAESKLRWRLPAILGLAAVALLALGVVLWRTPPSAPAAALIDAPALVLPAQIDAGADWEWLRLGLMDFVATRLRRADLGTPTSEAVVGLLRQSPERDGAALLRAPELASPHTLRIWPSVTRRGGRWQVRLLAHSAQQDLTVDTEADDVLLAARRAVDTLLLRLDRHPPPVEGGDADMALDELLQRTRAAMLSDRLSLAYSLIREAEPALRERPEIDHRLAQIDLRAGDYDAVLARLTPLIERLSPTGQAVLRAKALTTLAAAHIRRNEPEAASEAYGEAIGLLENRHEPSALGLALLGRGLVAALAENLDAATADLGRARVQMATAGDTLGVAQVDLNLAEFEAIRRRPSAALQALPAIAERLERLGATEEYVHTMIVIAELQGQTLDHRAALATLDRIWPAESHTNNLRLRWRLEAERAEVLADNGRLAEAETVLAHIAAASDADQDALTRWRAGAVRARIAYAKGDAAAVDQAASGVLTDGFARGDVPRFAQTLLLDVRALHDLKRDPDAHTLLGKHREWLHADAWRSIYADLGEAALAEPAAARPIYARAFEAAMGHGTPDDLAESASAYATALIAAGDLDAARAVSGRVAAWEASDLRVARLFASLYRGLGEDAARERAEATARELAGERPVTSNVLSTQKNKIRRRNECAPNALSPA